MTATPDEQSVLTGSATVSEAVAVALSALEQAKLPFQPPPTRDDVAAAIVSAARATNVPFTYLWRTAERESNLDPSAMATTSSARGLFQFVDGTWLRAMARHGAKHGYRYSAAAIVTGEDGGLRLSDPSLRSRILSLRMDPWLSARLAGELARENRLQLAKALGPGVGEADLYLAHLLGPAGAIRLIQAARLRPHTSAADILPAAARANPWLFYRSGRAVTARALLMALREG